jgi:hypothetical protein
MRNAHRSVIVPSGQAIMDRIADDHAAMFEKKLEEILNEHGTTLDAPGMSLKVQQSGLKFIYTLERDGVVLSTFGLELDLTGSLNYSVQNDVDMRKILGVK